MSSSSTTQLDRRLLNSRANCGVFITDRSVVLIDVRGGWGQALRTSIAQITAKPLTTIINMHAHPGYVNSNPEGFAPTVEILAHAAGRECRHHIRRAAVPLTGFGCMGVVWPIGLGIAHLLP